MLSGVLNGVNQALPVVEVVCFATAGLVAGRKIGQAAIAVSSGGASKVAAYFEKNDWAKTFQVTSDKYRKLAKEGLARDLTIAAGFAVAGLAAHFTADYMLEVAKIHTGQVEVEEAHTDQDVTLINSDTAFDPSTMCSLDEKHRTKVPVPQGFSSVMAETHTDQDVTLINNGTASDLSTMSGLGEEYLTKKAVKLGREVIGAFVLFNMVLGVTGYCRVPK